MDFPLQKFGTVIAVLIVWTAIVKGVALWRAARRNDLGWFVAMLVIQTAGILELIYIFGFSERPTTTNKPQ